MKVLLTHGEGRLEGLAAALRARGLEVAHHPLIETEFLQGDDLCASARRLLASDWLLFTSRTAVQAWAALGLPLGVAPRIGVVGGKTAAEVAQRGGQVTLKACPAHAKGLLETFRARVRPPARVGLPCAEQALPALAEGLVRAGFTVSRVHLYRTTAKPFPDAQADLIVVASPSAVAALPGTGEKARLVALGPSTRRAAEARGLHATQAATPDVAGVVEAILKGARDPVGDS